MKRITFCTGNAHKFAEVQHLISSEIPDLELIQSKAPLIEIQADCLEDVAKFKVNSVINLLNPPYFVEDAGFFVDDTLRGFPGVYSSYVMKSIGYAGILKILGNIDPRKAHFEAVIAYCDENKEIHLFKGENHGTVAYDAKGNSGFGFDPIFISSETPGKTFAELTMEEKNKISHRRRAFIKLIDYLKTK
jgi:XTP/dITP diphosphohydrolase